MSRIGVFICHCGENIAGTVDVARVAEAARAMRGVAYSTDYRYMCSDPGQALVRDAIREHRLTGVVVAACSPQMHEATFRRAAAEAGLNAYLCEMANIREHCSWVHEDRERATAKAMDLVRARVEKVKRNSELAPIRVPVTPRALVIGGGIAGIQAALDIANAGAEVILVEKEPSIGGHMAQLSETFPTLDCSQCILTPRMVEVAQHPNITLHAYAEVEEVEGYIGNFEAKIRLKGRCVDPAICTGCGACHQACPANRIPSEFDVGLGQRTAIYTPFPQAVPNKPVIDQANCLRFKAARRRSVPVTESDVCGRCLEACPIEPKSAVDFSLNEDTFITEKVGAIVLCVGYDLWPREGYGEYGQGRYADVISGLQFERLASASGPTRGRILRPSDGREPKDVAFIQCVGSRDTKAGLPYCSRICCMYTAKHAVLYKHKVPDGRAHVFYIDVRAGGKGYEEFVRRAIEEDDALYYRGRVSRIYQEDGRLVVKGTDTLAGVNVEIAADMVVLATAVVAHPDTARLAQAVRVACDAHGFLAEAHPKLRPVESQTPGVFLAGCCQGPKDIPDTVAQASAAASKTLALFSKPELEREPLVARVDRRPPPVYSTCAGCWACVEACPYDAMEKDEIRDRAGNLIKTVARVNEGVCQGCGLCAAVCRSNSIDLQGFTDSQIFAEIAALQR